MSFFAFTNFNSGLRRKDWKHVGEDMEGKVRMQTGLTSLEVSMENS